MELDLRSMETNTKFSFPRWARAMLHLYAFLIFIGTFFVIGTLFYEITVNAGKFLSGFINAPAEYQLLIVGVILLGCLVIVTQFYYMLALVRMKKWVLPVVWVATVSWLINDAGELFSGSSFVTEELLGMTVGSGFVLGLTVVTIKYRRYFDGPYRYLLFQVPLVVFFIFTAVYNFFDLNLVF